MLQSVLHFSLEITTISVIHHNTELSLFGLIDLTEADNVRMVKYFQNLGFEKSFPLLLLTHSRDIYLLDDSHLFVRLAFNQVSCSERASA